MHINDTGRIYQIIEGYSLYLNEIRKNLAALFAGTPRSGAPDRRFPLNFVPFMQYAG